MNYEQFDELALVLNNIHSLKMVRIEMPEEWRNLNHADKYIRKYIAGQPSC